MIAKIFKILLLLLLPSYLIAAFIYAQYEYEKEVCSGIEIIQKNKTEQQFLSDKDILTIIRDNKLVKKGEPLNNINRDKIEKSIEKNFIIDNVECYMTPSGKIKIEVEQRIPVMRVITPYDSYYIDKNRRKMPLSDKIIVYLPVASGNINEDFAKNKLFDFVQFISTNSKWDKQIEQIVVTDKEEIELIPRVGKQLILFGKISNFERKFSSLDLLYSQIFQERGWNYYNNINLKYDGRIICTKNNK